ncbi:hypothetical protein C8R44DRAFT_736109 [Mycena epipterygia]|nr:hypothetical protein C8R44DRAFT_736109 [Mycena epipterygia]
MTNSGEMEAHTQLPGETRTQNARSEKVPGCKMPLGIQSPAFKTITAFPPHVDRGRSKSTCSFLGNHPKIAIYGSPANAGGEIVAFLDLQISPSPSLVPQVFSS